MKKSHSIHLAVIALLSLFSTNLFAQTDRELATEILRLRDYSITYDTYAQSKPTKYPEELKVAEKKYRDQINKIKKGPNKDKYIKYLNKATGVDSLKYKNTPGMYYISLNPVELQRVKALPTQLEYFKVVKYSLFTQNKEDLIRPENVPFLAYKEKIRKKTLQSYK